jgi:oligoendopeptidase F
VRTLLHEGGHAFHTLACRGEPLAAYRESPLEFCEVASMTMELFGARNLDPFYDQAEADRSNRKLLEGIVLILPWIATVDAFQHWIYTHPGHTRDDRGTAWRSLIDRFGGIVDWSGYEEARDHSWHRQLHIFLYPFYSIEYGIAQLGALQLWRRELQRLLAELHRDSLYPMMGKDAWVAGADRGEAPGPKPVRLGRRLRLRRQPPGPPHFTFDT